MLFVIGARIGAAGMVLKKRVEVGENGLCPEWVIGMALAGPWLGVVETSGR